MNLCKLNTIATIYNGNSINKTEKEQKYMNDVPGWNYIGTKDIDFNGKVTYKNGVIIPYTETKFRVAPAGTIFVCSEGGSAGKKSAIISEDVCFGNKLFAIVNDKGKFSSKYIYYYTRYSGFTKQFKLLATSLMGGISGKNFGTIEVPLPSIEEQQKIVTRIEKLFSELDKGVETLQTIKQQLAVYRQAVLKAAFEGILTKSPVEKFESLGNLIEKPRYGTSKKCDYEFEEHSTPVYRIPNICYRLGTINKEDIKFAKFTAAELHDLRLQNGDILIIRSNGSVSLVGRAAIVRESDIDGTFAGYLMRLRIKDSAKINPRYLLHYLSSHNARMYIENKAKSTSGVNNINSSEICGLNIPIVEYIEQLLIVDAIESRLSVCDSIEQTVDTALSQAEAMRQSILKKAFEGGFSE